LSSDNFQFITELGEEGSGIVVLAKGKLPGGPEQLYAIKATEKQSIAWSNSISEINAEKEASCFQNKNHFLF
jgi:hypothetical protein